MKSILFMILGDIAICNTLIELPSSRYAIVANRDSIYNFKIEVDYNSQEEITYLWYIRSGKDARAQKIQEFLKSYEVEPFSGFNKSELSYDPKKDQLDVISITSWSYFCVVSSTSGSLKSKEFNFLPEKTNLNLDVLSGYALLPQGISEYYYASVRLHNSDPKLNAFIPLYENGPFDISWEVVKSNSDFNIYHDSVGINSRFYPKKNDVFELKCNIFLEDYIDTSFTFSGINNKYPIILNEPEDVIALEGTSATFTSSLYHYDSYSGNLPTLKWRKNGLEINDDRATIKNYIVNGANVKSILEIKNLTLEDTGKYSIEASNYCNVINESKEATLKVEERTKSVTNFIDQLKVKPNPFDSENKILLQINNPSHVKIDLYDNQGTLILRVEDSFLTIGEHIYVIKSKDLKLSPGVYFYIIHVDGEPTSKKIIKS